MTDGGNIVHWAGSAFSRICLPPGLIDGALLKMWGTSSSDLYGVGREGTIIHYNGTFWRQIESGTELDFNDIFGATNPATGEVEVYAVAAKQFVTLDRRIVRIMGATVQAVSDTGIPGSLQGLWFKPGRGYYVAGNGMYWKRNVNASGPWLSLDVTQYYLYGIRGEELNDVVSCGTFGEVVYFNGTTWRSYRSVTGLNLGLYYRIAIRDNLLVAVGFDDDRAMVIRGIR